MPNLSPEGIRNVVILLGWAVSFLIILGICSAFVAVKEWLKK